MVFIRRTRQDWVDFIFNYNWHHEKKTKIKLSTSSRSCHDVPYMWLLVYHEFDRTMVNWIIYNLKFDEYTFYVILL